MTTPPPDPVVLALFMGVFGCIVLFMLYLSWKLPPDDERWEMMASADQECWRNKFQ